MRLSLTVKPNARQAALTQREDGTWLAEVNAPPVDGKANAAVVALVAKHFGVSKSRVSIESGAAARTKRIFVDL